MCFLKRVIDTLKKQWRTSCLLTILHFDLWWGNLVFSTSFNVLTAIEKKNLLSDSRDHETLRP